MCFFIGLVPVENASAKSLYTTLVSFCRDIGLTDEFMQKHLIGFCSDGASAMTGEHKGLARLLKDAYPLVKSFHCMAHRLELAVKDAVDTVNSVSHFRILVDAIYKVYSQSPKNQREIDEIACNMSVQLMRIQKVFDVRWVFSSLKAVTALLTDFPALYSHYVACSSDGSNRNGRDRSKFKGLANKICSWFFVAETSMIRDALATLSMLSLFLQSESATVVTAMAHVEACSEKLIAMKEANGQHLAKFLDSFKADGTFMGIAIVQDATDEARFQSLRAQFFSALIDNIRQRFPATALMKAAGVLNQTVWPSDPLQRAMFGEAEVANLCNDLCIESAESANILLDFAMYKKGHAAGKHLLKMLCTLHILPISSAACERGFSQLNLHQTSLRNRLAVSRINDLMMVSINGPPLRDFNARKYVLSWIRSGRHTALDKPTGIAPKEADVPLSAKLFA